jgi:membrane protease YdiL (CAAX protease family)
MVDPRRRDAHQIVELVIIVTALVTLFLLKPEYVWVYESVALIYLFVERRARRRPWEDIGLKTRSIMAGIKSNFPIVILVSLFIQYAVIAGSSVYYLPLLLRLEERVEYLQAHLGSFAPAASFIGFIALATLMEELLFRGLVQERVSWYTDDYTGIAVGSIVMTMIHFSMGVPLAVFLDLFFVFLDSVLYGVIYMRSRSVLVSWSAHLLADLVGIYLLWTL